MEQIAITKLKPHPMNSQFFDEAILKDLIETNLRQRGMIGGSQVKLGRRIKELERIYGVRQGKVGETRGSNGTLGKSAMTQSNLANQLGVDLNT